MEVPIIEEAQKQPQFFENPVENSSIGLVYSRFKTNSEYQHKVSTGVIFSKQYVVTSSKVLYYDGQLTQEAYFLKSTDFSHPINVDNLQKIFTEEKKILKISFLNLKSNLAILRVHCNYIQAKDICQISPIPLKELYHEDNLLTFLHAAGYNGQRSIHAARLYEEDIYYAKEKSSELFQAHEEERRLTFKKGFNLTNVIGNPVFLGLKAIDQEDKSHRVGRRFIGIVTSQRQVSLFADQDYFKFVGEKEEK